MKPGCPFSKAQVLSFSLGAFVALTRLSSAVEPVCRADWPGMGVFPQSQGMFRSDLDSILRQAPEPIQCSKEVLAPSKVVEGCKDHESQWRAYLESCADLTAQRDPQRPESVALRRELLKVLYDRELMLMNRLPPIGEYKQYWDRFKEKWEKRLEADPAVKVFDQSSALTLDEKGGLAVRVAAIDRLRPKSVEQHQKLAESFGLEGFPGTEFYALAAALAIKSMESPEVRDFALKIAKKDKNRESGLSDEEQAQTYIDVDRNQLYQIYPEMDQFIDGTRPLKFLLGQGVTLNDLGAEMLRPDEKGNVPTLSVRLNRFIKKVSDLKKQKPAVAEWLKNAKAKADQATLGVIAKLDQMAESAKTDPSGQMTDPMILIGTISSLTTANPDKQLRQSLQSRYCVHRIDSERDRKNWARFTTINDAISNASLWYFGAGVVYGFGARMAGAAAPRLAAGLAQEGSLLMKSIDGSGWIASGIGSQTSGAGMVRHIQERNQRVNEFYRSNGSEGSTKRSDVEQVESAVRWSGVSLFMQLFPFFVSP